MKIKSLSILCVLAAAIFPSLANSFPTDMDGESLWELWAITHQLAALAPGDALPTEVDSTLRTHPWLAYAAINDFQNRFPDADLSTGLKREIIFGSIEEDIDSNCDDPLNDITIPLCQSTPSNYRTTTWEESIGALDTIRPLNHFYAGTLNNFGPNYGKLTDDLPDWFPIHSARYWVNSIGYNYIGVNQISNGTNSITRARALGHLLHLLSDMTSPAHVRNDAHPWGDSDPYEAHLKSLNFNSQKPQLTTDNDFDFESCAATIQECFDNLADWTQQHFYSEDTVMQGSHEGMSLLEPSSSPRVVRWWNSKYYLVSTQSGNLEDRLAVFGLTTLNFARAECLPQVWRDYDTCMLSTLRDYADGGSNRFNTHIDTDCQEDFWNRIGPINIRVLSRILESEYEHVTGVPLPVAGIINGDFEAGNWTGWTTGGDYNYRIVSSVEKNDGSNAAVLGRWDTSYHGADSTAEPSGYEWIYQDVVVPSTATYLKFSWWMETYDTAAWDWFDAYIKNTSGGILQTILSHAGKPGTNYGPYWNTRQAYGGSGWQDVQVDISAYRGQTIRIYFDQRLDGWGDQQRVFIDSVRFQ